MTRLAQTLPSSDSPALSSARIELAEQMVPRYTSYPTAPHFGPTVGPEAYRNWLAQLSPCTTLSLYLHVPFCAAMCAYCGCHTKVVRKHEPVDAYRDRLIAEIDLIAGMTTARRVGHLHWGGGTPTMLRSEGLAAVVERIALRFGLADGAEHAIELDPRQVTRDLARDLARLGITRASLGVQDLNPHVQSAIGRIQPYAIVAAAVEHLRAAGIDAISFDLMYGLPHQSEADLLGTIKRATVLGPDRIALFGYAHVPWFKTHQRLIDDKALADPKGRFRQASAARQALVASGYRAVGLDHFALPEDTLVAAADGGHLKRNFQGYSVDDADALLGFGASAIGKLPQGYVQNAPDIGGYQRAIDLGQPATVRGLALSQEDRLRAAVIEQLMCGFGTDLAAAADQFGFAPALFDDDLQRLEPLEREGLVARDGRKVTVLEPGQPFVRVVASIFDAHLAKAGRHSAAV